MPQLMPLYWVSYTIVFMMLFFMMKGVYSIYILESGSFLAGKNKILKDMWLW